MLNKTLISHQAYLLLVTTIYFDKESGLKYLCRKMMGTPSLNSLPIA